MIQQPDQSLKQNGKIFLSTEKKLKEVNNKLIEFTCNIFEMNEETFIRSKTEKACELKLYIFHILKNSFGATSKEISKLYIVSM